MSLTPRPTNCSFLSPPLLHVGSALNRCVVGRYFSLGLFSVVSDATIGSYCSFGSRVSVGGFSHPTHLFSVHEVSYRDTMPFFGESVFSANLAEFERPKTIIGSDVYVGDNAVIRSGVVIGNGVVVGAGAVVTHNIEDYAIVVGNPAKVLRYRFCSHVVRELQATRWWELEMGKLRVFVDSGGFSFLNRLCPECPPTATI